MPLGVLVTAFFFQYHPKPTNIFYWLQSIFWRFFHYSLLVTIWIILNLGDLTRPKWVNYTISVACGKRNWMLTADLPKKWQMIFQFSSSCLFHQHYCLTIPALYNSIQFLCGLSPYHSPAWQLKHGFPMPTRWVPVWCNYLYRSPPGYTLIWPLSGFLSLYRRNMDGRFPSGVLSCDRIGLFSSSSLSPTTFTESNEKLL